MKIINFEKSYKQTFPVGEGWRKLVTKLVQDIIKIDSTIEVVQVKEKFGGLRFYIDGVDTKNLLVIYHLISKAERESYKTCESCGTKKGVTTKGSWVLTLCEKCRKKRNE